MGAPCCFGLLQPYAGEEAESLFPQGKTATVHLSFVHIAGSVLPPFRHEERTMGRVGPAWRQQFVVFIRKRFFVVQFGMRELRASEHGLPMPFDILAFLTLTTIHYDLQIYHGFADRMRHCRIKKLLILN